MNTEQSPKNVIEHLIECDPVAVKIVDVNTLLLLLHSPEASVVSTALDGLTKHAEISIKILTKASKNRSALISLGILSNLMELCVSEDKSIKKSAISCLATVTELPEIPMELKNKDLLKMLLAVLNQEEQVEILDEAAFALSNLVKDFANKVELRKLNGIQTLMKLLDVNDPDVKKSAAMALSNALNDFGSRTDIRFASPRGLRPIIDLLSSEHLEVQEQGLKCLMKCIQDYYTAVELKKLGLSKRLAEFLAMESTEPNYQLALSCLEEALQDVETAACIADCNGTQILMKLSSNEDSKIRKQASVTLSKALMYERNQIIAKECGYLATATANLSSPEFPIAASAATVIAALAKNDTNQTEFVKAGVVEQLLKYLLVEDKELRREAAGALISFCSTGNSIANSAKSRSRIRNFNDGVNSILKLLMIDDIPTLANLVDCLAAFADDCCSIVNLVPSKNEIIKAGGTQALVPLLDIADTKLQSSVCICLARLLQEGKNQFISAEGQNAIVKQSKQVMTKLVSMLNMDLNLCRVATYTISIAAQNGSKEVNLEVNAINACNVGALDILIKLSRNSQKKSTNFALDGLEKLLNYNLSAKYALLNHLANNNIISDGFYDSGYVGINVEKVEPFPTLTQLQALSVDKRREVILIDASNDLALQSAITFLVETLQGNPPEVQLKMVAATVANMMGGPIDPNNLSKLNFKFRLSELKIEENSNVLHIGKIKEGTFYHRALLFKALCDKVGLKTCSLTRGEYNRAWNLVDPRNQTIEVIKSLAKEKRNVNSARPKSHGVAATTAPAAPVVDYRAIYFKEIPLDFEPYNSDVPALIDLMFNPGKLMPIDSPEATAYKRISDKI